MAVATTELKKIQRELKQVQKRLTKLETQTRQTRRRSASRKRVKQVGTRGRTRVTQPKTNNEIIEMLTSRGFLRELTIQEKQLAEEWRALSQKEKDKVNRELANVRLDQTVAELIAQVRS